MGNIFTNIFDSWCPQDFRKARYVLTSLFSRKELSGKEALALVSLLYEYEQMKEKDIKQDVSKVLLTEDSSDSCYPPYMDRPKT